MTPIPLVAGAHWWAMAAPEPNVRYFDARPTRPHRWLLVGALTALALVAIAVVIRSTTDWFDSDGGSAGAIAAGDLPQASSEGAGGAAPEVVAATDDDRAAASDLTSVVVVGDSITQGSRDAIRYVLTADGFTDVTVDGVPSRRIEAGGGANPESGIQAIYRMLAEGADPDVWVIALGTNDIGKYPTDEEYAGLVRFVLDIVPDGRPLVWVDAFRDDYPDDSRRFNEVLEGELAERDGTALVRWADAVTNDPSLLRDGVHPRDEGEAVFAILIAEALSDLT